MRATREQRNQHHQVRQGKQPLIRLDSGGLCPRDEPEMAALGKIAKMV